MTRARLGNRAVLFALAVSLQQCKRDKNSHELPVSSASNALGSRSQTGPAGDTEPKISPEELTLAVRSTLERDPGVDATTISVRADAGAILLTGTAPNLLSKERAGKIVQGIRGVTSVDNRVAVQTPAVSDDELALRVRQALVLDPAADSIHVTPKASNGVVMLVGAVDSWVEYEAAERAAMRVRGVRAVQNDLIVNPKTSRSDAEIERDVKDRLRWDELIGSSLIDVAVKDGTVVLKGFVGSAAERARAYRLAGLVTGVKNVAFDELFVRWWAPDKELRRRTTQPSDREIHDAIRAAALFDPRVKTYNIEPIVKDGRVTLTGRVDNALAKVVAESIALHTSGVIDVKNEVTVAAARPIDDATLKKQVTSALALNPVVSVGQVEVEAKQGVISLTGEVEDHFEQAQAEEAASRVRGVQGINNKLKVKRPERAYVYDAYLEPHSPVIVAWQYVPITTARVDRDIRDQIVKEMSYSPFVDADQVAVSVVNGVATLTGRVDSQAERRAATENAYEGGALRVVNQLTVGGT